MAFHDIRFPEKIAVGAVGGAEFNTEIRSLNSGLEKRNQNWSDTRHVFDVSHGIKTQNELDELKEFFLARQGRTHSFRFKDWSDYELDRQLIGTGDGSALEFQIFKLYTSSTQTYTRNLEKIVSGTISVWVAGTLQSAGSDYTVNLLTGKISFTSAPATGQNIEVKCEFDVPVRFNTDQMRVSFDDYNIYTWGQIPIIEVKGE